MSLLDGKLVYPQGLALSDRDIAFMNENTGAKFVKRTDKFIPTSALEKEAKKVKIENKGLSLWKELHLSGKFLKNKAFTIAVSAFMVAVIMMILSLAQTMIHFDAGRILQEEMVKTKQSALLLNKTVDEETQALLEHNYRVAISDGDIQAFKNSGYAGDVYPVLNVSVPVVEYRNSAGTSVPYFRNSIYITETLGTIIADQTFLEKKFGKIEYLAQAEEFHPSGVIITDYVADGILAMYSQYKSYDEIIGAYNQPWGAATRIYINAIINTEYESEFQPLIDRVKEENTLKLADLYNEDDFREFVSEIYNCLGYCYTLNQNYIVDFNKTHDVTFMWHDKININGKFDFIDPASPYITFGANGLGKNEAVVNLDEYNKMFGTNYSPDNYNSFVPHTATITGYRFYDVDNSDPLYHEEIKIVGLRPNVAATMFMNIEESSHLLTQLSKNSVYANALYLDGTEGLESALNLSEELNYEHQNISVEGIHTMTKAVNVFVPIFELVNIVMCLGVVFIFVSFSTKMINSKMHEIGILKALGTKNGTILTVFGIQVLLIALLTALLATAGYYYFIGFANTALYEAMLELVPNQIVLELNFLTFQPDIAAGNCILVAALAVVSLIFPMLKIKAIKPVKIIKAKE